METIKASLTLRLQNEEKLIHFEGTRIAFVGPSGCGKSTLAKILVGVSDKGSGSFHLGKTDLMQLPTWERKIGYTPQDLILLPHLSVKENLLYPVDSILNQDVIEGLALGHLLERMPRHLSGGEKQRVALARSFSGNPKLLILDEPFSSLDLKTKERVVNFVNHTTLSLKIPYIFISHDENEIQHLGCTSVHFS
jgi:molybdate transport system ATP-binding protein